MNKQHNILYIMGTGRTGTTILEILLSNTPAIRGLGEVTKLFRDGFFRNETCSCGQPFSTCSHWKPVRDQFLGMSCDDIRRCMDTVRFFDWHTNFFAHWAGVGFEERFQLYGTINDRIYRSMGESWEGRYLLDSSKYAGRALGLQRMYPGRVKILCMTRSPQGLISSFRKRDAGEQKPKSLPNVVAYYSYVLLCCRLVARKRGMDVLHMRYEDLLQDPVRELGRIGNWLSLDLSPSQGKIERNEPLARGHIITGNRLRRQRELRFSGDHSRGRSTPVEGVASACMNGVRALLGF